MEENLSNRIYVFKALCLFSIVLASTPYKGIDNIHFVRLLGSFSLSGIIGFFIVAGFLFGKCTDDIFTFLKKKIKLIVIPWLFGALFWYFYTLYHGNGFDMKEMFLFLLGKNNLFVLFPVLLVCYCILWIFRRNKIVLYIFIILNFITRALSIMGVIKYVGYNFFNYIGMFSIGIIISNGDYNLGEFDGHKITFFSIFFIAMGIMFKNENPLIDVMLWFISSFGWISLTYVLAFNHLDDSAVLKDLGKLTMPIYMYHLLLSPKIFIDGIMIDNFFVAVCRPFAVIGIMYGVLRLLIIGFNETPLEKGFKVLLGIRL